LPFNGLPKQSVAPETPFAFWTRPPPPRKPFVPPPPSQPFNTNHRAMIENYGGAIWHSGTRTYLPPLMEQAVTPFMHMDPISGVFALFIYPYESYVHALPTVSDLTQPPQVSTLMAVHNLENVSTYTTVPSSSLRAPHSQI
jgi:hypothetical protein